MRRLFAAATARMRPVRRLHPDHEIVVRAFDTAFYLQTQPDVAATGTDPLEHFLAYGWREGRDPSAEFSVADYLAAFPEVERSGINPFVHYLTTGRPKAVVAENPLGFRYEVIETLAPVADRIEKATAGDISLGTQGDLAAALATSRGGLAGLHLTFSHDDYSAHVGGLQLSIQREAARLAAEGRDHLHLHPAKPWPVVRTAADPGGLGVVWNGRALGAFSAEAVIGALAGAATNPAEGRSLAIHSLLGHAADEVADIAATAGLTGGTFWLHDFASLCAGFHLLRNDVEDCAAPPPDSAACGICVYGPWRARHTRAHARLFERLRLTVAAPSQVTLDLWRASTDLPAAGTAVLPHATLTPTGPAPVPGPSEPFRVAYAGLPVAHKGWPIFRALAIRFEADPRYEFVHLGVRPDDTAPVRFHDAATGAERPLAMVEALRAVAPDVVLVWPICRETFSFVAYEAVAAGAAVVTGPDSGNVAAFVDDTGHGRVLADEAALRAAFETGEILQLARTLRHPMLYDLAFSALTLDLAPHPGDEPTP